MGLGSGLQDKEIDIDVEGGEKEDPQGPVQKTRRYSFSTRREPGPLDEDVPASKTMSLSLVFPVVTSSRVGNLTTKAPKRKGSHKTEEDASRKTHSRKNDSKKAESEAAKTTTPNSRAKILHSGAKPAQ